MRLAPRTPIPIIVPAALLVLACMPEANTGPGGVDTGGEEICEGPLGAPRDPDTLVACCQDVQGDAHCLAESTVPAEIRSYVDVCEGGGVCIPDKFIETGGVFTPTSCASLNGEAGVCLSICIPQAEPVNDFETPERINLATPSADPIRSRWAC